jgi:two-component system NtrC family sensor kinase
LIELKRKKMNRHLKVDDNGNGIPENIKKNLSAFLYQQGTGLGLSLAYDIITKGHGGELKVETLEDRGSEFIISLPL